MKLASSDVVDLLCPGRAFLVSIASSIQFLFEVPLLDGVQPPRRLGRWRSFDL